MLKKLTFLIFIVFANNHISAQKLSAETEPFCVSLFITANKTIYVETKKTEFQNIENEVSKIIRNKPFKIDEKIVYRIFADENLDLGFIIDVNHEMLSAYNENVHSERYLLNTVELNIDGQNWFDSIDMHRLKKQDM